VGKRDNFTWGRVLPVALVAVLLLSACETPGRTPGLSEVRPMSSAGIDTPPVGVAQPRLSGPVLPSNVAALPRPTIVYGDGSDRGAQRSPRSAAGDAGGGDVTLNFVDTDIREVVRVVLGDLLKVTYSIDPTVKGSATLKTASAVSRTSLLPLLEAMLGQNGAALVQRDGVYTVVPAAAARAGAALGGAESVGDVTEVIPLRYASAAELAKVLDPYIASGGKISVGPGKNTLVVSGSTSVRNSLTALIRSFDVDFLAGQSYAIYPVASADPAKVAEEVQRFVQAGGEGEQSGPVHVITLDRINAVLVVSSNAGYLDRIGRFIAQVDAVGDSTARRLHVYYVQNSTAVDLASLLQRAFAPQASSTGTGNGSGGGVGSLVPNAEPAIVAAPAPPAPMQATVTPIGTPGIGAAGLGTATPGTTGGSYPQSSGLMSSAPSAAAQPPEPEPPVSAKGIRFIADKKNNALLIFATPAEYNLIEAALRKIDILPLQVLVEATIIEVTLTDALQYGTQFFFKSGRIKSTLSDAATGLVTPQFPGFAFAFANQTAQAAISALQSLTKVKVISDPQLLVLNNESARLQVGDLVPIVTQSAVAVQTPGAPVVNSVEYHETGVILDVTPRVNSGGLVTLDISQEVSEVTANASAIQSPTINQRKIKSRIVVQDGETIGLGGLIKDTNTIDNNGVPLLTNIPIIGALFGSRDHSIKRTELLVLLTPRVIQDQRTARALTEDLRAKFGALSAIPDQHDPLDAPGPLRH
jgi:general secretion pathway protein D